MCSVSASAERGTAPHHPTACTWWLGGPRRCREPDAALPGVSQRVAWRRAVSNRPPTMPSRGGVKTPDPSPNPEKSHTSRSLRGLLRGYWRCASAQARLIALARPRFLRELDGKGDISLHIPTLLAYVNHIATLTQGGGAFAGAPLILAPWQIVLLSQLCARQHRDGSPATSLAMIEVARGNGKSELMAAYTAARFALETSQQEVIFHASKLDQARIVRDRLKAMTRADPLWEHLFHYSRHARGVARPVAAEAKHMDGLSPSLAIVDEAARHREHGLDVLLSAIAKRPDAQVVCISTPDPRNLLSPYRNYRRAAIEQLERDELDPAWIALLWGASADDPPTAPATWRLANPGLGTMPNMSSKKIEAECRTMYQVGGEQRQEWLNQRLCVDSVTSVTMLDMADFSATAAPYPRAPDAPCIIGVDFAAGGTQGSLDLCAVCWGSWCNDVLRCGLRYLFPAMRQLDAVSKARHLPLREWIDQGLLEPAGDEALDFACVTRAIADIAGKHSRVITIGVDPCARQSSLIEEHWLKRWPVVKVPQTTVVIAPAWGLTHELFKTRKLTHPGDDVLRAAITRTHVQVMPGGLTRPMKGMGDAMSDPIMAMVMMVALAARNREGSGDYASAEVIC